MARWNVPDRTVGVHTAALLLGQTAGNLILAWLAPSTGWYYAAFALSGLTLGAIIVSGILMVMGFSRRVAARPASTIGYALRV